MFLASDCGKSCARKPLIGKGKVTYAGEFPWQAMLCVPPTGQYCGGVLVSSDCVITAAHCVVNLGNPIKNISLCLGRQCGNCSETDQEGSPQCFKPQSAVVHDKFNRRTFDNDIAVLKLSHNVSCDCTSVFPVCLPNGERDESYMRDDMRGLVTGWGRVNSTIGRPRCLRKGYVHFAPPSVCASRHPQYNITESMMCATDNNGACEGDSGGPLVVRNRQYGNRYVVAGIVSWGGGCSKASHLGVYTKVLSHLEWIRNACNIRD